MGSEPDDPKDEPATVFMPSHPPSTPPQPTSPPQGESAPSQPPTALDHKSGSKRENDNER